MKKQVMERLKFARRILCQLATLSVAIVQDSLMGSKDFNAFPVPLRFTNEAMQQYDSYPQGNVYVKTCFFRRLRLSLVKEFVKLELCD